MVYVLPEPVCSSSRAQQSASQARPTASQGYSNRAWQEECSYPFMCKRK